MNKLIESSDKLIAMPQIIKRYSEPHKYDQAPFGTICHVIDDNEYVLEIYKQISKDPDNPIWKLEDR